MYTNIMGEGCLAMVWSSAARGGGGISPTEFPVLFCFTWTARPDGSSRRRGIALTVVSWLFLFFSAHALEYTRKEGSNWKWLGFLLFAWFL